MSLNTLFSDCMEWHRENIPDAANREKARQELNELDRAYEAQEILDESVDVVVCLLGYLRQTGLTVDDFIVAFYDKMVTLTNRTWEKQADGTYQHIEAP